MTTNETLNPFPVSGIPPLPVEWLRFQRGVTRSALARAAGLDRTYLYRVERSRLWPSPEIDRIVCEDETTTTPRDKVLNVVFQLRNADTGTPVETRSVNPGAIPREVSFSGLANGSYEIRHTVQARDCSATFTTYAGLEVF